MKSISRLILGAAPFPLVLGQELPDPVVETPPEEKPVEPKPKPKKARATKVPSTTT